MNITQTYNRYGLRRMGFAAACKEYKHKFGSLPMNAKDLEEISITKLTDTAFNKYLAWYKQAAPTEGWPV